MEHQPVNKHYRGNMMVIEFGYSNSVILPIEEGQPLLALLANAESYTKDYGKDPVIKPMDMDIKISFIARTTYERCKLGFLEIPNGID